MMYNFTIVHLRLTGTGVSSSQNLTWLLNNDLILFTVIAINVKRDLGLSKCMVYKLRFLSQIPSTATC